MGTARHDYVEMARRIDKVTGGLGVGAQARVLNGRPGSCLPMVTLSAKCLNRNLTPMVSIVEELIGEMDFSNLGRLKQLSGEYLSALEAAVVQNGHRLAISLSSRNFGPADALNEMWNGLHQIGTLRSLNVDDDDSAFERLATRMRTIAEAVFVPQNVILAAIGETEVIDCAKNELENSPMLSEYREQSASTEFSTA